MKMIARAKYTPKRNVLVYRGFEAAKLEGNPMTKVIQALREDSAYKVIEVYVERASLANHNFDIVLCDLDAPSQESSMERNRFYKNLRRFARESKVPVYINPSQSSLNADSLTLESLADWNILAKPRQDVVAA